MWRLSSRHLLSFIHLTFHSLIHSIFIDHLDSLNPLQRSCLENPTDGGVWWATVHGVAKSWTRLSDFTFTSHFCALEKEMATHSSVLAWRIPGTGEPGGLPSLGSHRVGHDWSDSAAADSLKLRTGDTIVEEINLFFNSWILCKHKYQLSY